MRPEWRHNAGEYTLVGKVDSTRCENLFDSMQESFRLDARIFSTRCENLYDIQFYRMSNEVVSLDIPTNAVMTIPSFL